MHLMVQSQYQQFQKQENSNWRINSYLF